MKLRFFGNTVRWRLNRREVARLAAGITLQDATLLTPQPLRFSITASACADCGTARFADGTLELILPRSIVSPWAESDEITLDQQAGAVRLLIEKDLQCLHGEGETDEQEDCYPNPVAMAEHNSASFPVPISPA